MHAQAFVHVDVWERLFRQRLGRCSPFLGHEGRCSNWRARTIVADGGKATGSDSDSDSECVRGDGGRVIEGGIQRNETRVAGA